MTLQALDPTPLGLHIAMNRGAIPDCPFCGRHALLHSSVNHAPLFGGTTLYQSRISCTNHHCNASVLRNERTLEAAQAGVMERWAMRIPVREKVAAEDACLADIGQALMDTLRGNATHPALKNWRPINCPAEIVADLLNLIDEAREGRNRPKWPEGREAGRMGDMTPLGMSHLRVGLDADNDVYVAVYNGQEKQSAGIEFCALAGGGGGKSPRTREALIALMVAIEADNQECPPWAFPPNSSGGAS